MKPQTTPTPHKWGYVRVRSDERLSSQLRYLQTVSSIVLGERSPSASHLVRRAVGLLIQHYEGLITAEQDALEAERTALAEYSRIAEASPPKALLTIPRAIRAWIDSTIKPPPALGIEIIPMAKEETA